MVLLRVASRSKDKINAIAEILLKERLVIDLNIKEGIERIEYKDNGLESSGVFLLTGKTKGLLFPVIDERIRSEYPDNIPEIYSIPIVHMDWEQSKQLIEDVRGV